MQNFSRIYYAFDNTDALVGASYHTDLRNISCMLFDFSNAYYIPFAELFQLSY